MSTLVGIAVGDGRLRLDQPLAQLLPSYAATMTPGVAHTTLRQVLTMTAGLAGAFNPTADLGFATSPDWVRAILTHPAKPPSGSFVYSSGGSHLLSAILITATGQSVLDYARAKLFDPLSIPTRPALQPLFDIRNLDAYNTAGFAWPVDSQRRQLGFGPLKLRPRDMGQDRHPLPQPGPLARQADRARGLDPGRHHHPRAGRRRRHPQLRLPMVGRHRRRRPRLPCLGIRRSTDRGRSAPPPGRRHLHLPTTTRETSAPTASPLPP
jgi:CubicO group peptidase (beta-lactamase class C family)